MRTASGIITAGLKRVFLDRNLTFNIDASFNCKYAFGLRKDPLLLDDCFLSCQLTFNIRINPGQGIAGCYGDR